MEHNVFRAKSDISAESDYVAFAVSDDERLMALAKSTGELQVYDAATGGIVCHIFPETPHSAARPTAMSFSPDGQRIAVATNVASEIHLWDLQTGEPAGQLRGHDGIVRCLEFAPTSDRLYSGSYDGTIREWSLTTRSQLRLVD